MKGYDKYYCVFCKRVNGEVGLEPNHLLFDLEKLEGLIKSEV
ncbi:hypothetical protein [Methanocaldococcus infernus]|nr:hypothetical protein [Methanocaldococcus infernus]